MNKMIITSMAAVAVALMGSPIRAEAGHRDNDRGEIVAALGGFIGGVIVGSTIHGDAPRVGVSVSHRDHGHHNRHGHWELRTVRVWVPGYWAHVERHGGRTRKVWVEGHYDVRRERVWVAHRRHDRCGRC